MINTRRGLASGGHIRFIRQSEVGECGLATLAMIAAYHGFHIDLGTLRREYAPSLRGAPLRSLIGIADRMGLSSRAIKLRLGDLSSLKMPAILHWNMNHYVVLEKMRHGRGLIHDPALGSRWLENDELSQHFTGVALEVSPSQDFTVGDRRERLRLRQLWGRMTGLRGTIAQTLVFSLVMQAFVLASPYYLQIAVDQALPAFDNDLLAVLAIGFGLFTIVNAMASFLRGLVLVSAGASLSYGIAANVGRRLFRLPIDWFERRHVGDILSRFQSIMPIQQALTQGTVAALVDGILALLSLLLMFFYSPSLTFIALAAFLIYLIARLVSFAQQRSAQESTIVASAREQSILIETLRGIITLRLFNKESLRHAFWQTALTDASNSRVELGRITAWQQTTNSLLFGLETVLSVWLALRFVMAGGFSIGMVFAYLAYKTQFLTRGASLIDQVMSVRMLNLHLERLSDIALVKEDISFTQRRSMPVALSGRIELSHLRYQYSETDPLILRDVCLTIEAGDHIAITGPSGGGKSTLVKVMLGLIEPDAGEILVDGIPLKRFGYKNYHDQIAAVLQEDHLFAGSLADNIALFDDCADMDRVVAASNTAGIHSEILAMPMGYETLVGDMGSTLSGGQKQRVLLARALYRQPKLLIMDEGTSHLDADHESVVNAAIAGLGITRVVIAHRAETLGAAKHVYVLNDGVLTPKESTDPFR